MMAAAGLSAVLAGCTHPAETAPGFGHAVQMMQSRQAVPEAVSTTPPEGGGASGALAQTRYRTGQTKPLLNASTSSTNTSSR